MVIIKNVITGSILMDILGPAIRKKGRIDGFTWVAVFVKIAETTEDTDFIISNLLSCIKYYLSGS